ncbi:hypothetical protein [Streptomyces rubiginosohelvolus]|uniref:Uncharacterized protein n=1 Tax=Streptomyces rubiginosohelvolus TaxID=67362 RepID=A0ABW6F043_9ACTN
MKTFAPAALPPPTWLRTRASGGRLPARTDLAPAQPRAQISAAELCAMREADLRRALGRLSETGTVVRVGQYSLVGPRQNPADRLADAQAVIHRRRWTTTITTFDDAEAGDPALRPQLARLFTALDAGEIHGIVAVHQTDISPFPDIYACTLTILRARRGFLALARNESSI